MNIRICDNVLTGGDKCYTLSGKIIKYREGTVKMKSKTKTRWISVIVCAVIAISMSVFSPIMSMQVYADSLVYGDFKYEVEDNGEVTIIDYMGTETTVNVPETIEGKTVTQIGNYAFEETDIVNVTLPDSITKIGYCAFHNCNELETINL